MWGYCAWFVLPALLLTGAAMAIGGGPPPTPKQGVRLPRAAWRPRISAVGLVGGLALGLIIPSLMRVFAVRRVNKTIARAERRLNEALAQQSTPTTAAEHNLDQAPSQQEPPPPTVEAGQ
jgi:hypothetical protein